MIFTENRFPLFGIKAARPFRFSQSDAGQRIDAIAAPRMMPGFSIVPP
jgi:hypothetical protein